MRDAIANVGTYVGARVRKEVNVTGPGENGHWRERGGDVVISAEEEAEGGDGKDAALDVAVIQAGFSIKKLKAASKSTPTHGPDAYGRTVKDKKYKKATEASQLRNFVPVVVDQFGTFSKAAVKYLTALGMRIGIKASGDNTETRSVAWLFQRLSANLARENYKMVFRRRSEEELALQLQVLGGDAAAPALGRRGGRSRSGG